jgi:hypothetical protein
MRGFVARINEINEMMVEFPSNFDETQMISEPEMKDLLEFAVPTSWRVKMVEHALHPIEHDIPNIAELCERQEFTEKLMLQLAVVATIKTKIRLTRVRTIKGPVPKRASRAEMKWMH